MVKNYPTLEGFFIPEALCPLAIDPFIVALAASYIAPLDVLPGLKAEDSYC